MYTWVRSGIIRDGKLGEAIEFLRKHKAYVKDKTGAEVTNSVGIGGPIGNVASYAKHRDLSEIQAVEDVLLNDPGYVELMDTAAGLFVPESGMTRIYRDVE